MTGADLAPPPRQEPADGQRDDDRRRNLLTALRTACPPLGARVGPFAERLPPEGCSRRALRDPLEEALGAALPVAVDHRAADVARRLGAQLDVDATVSVDVDPGGFPERYARRALHALLVAATDRGEIDTRTVAVATLLLADRAAAQTVAAATGAVTAKRWVQPGEPGCPVHAGLDGTVVAADRCFTVAAGGIHWSAFLVGEDAPLACTCSQDAVVETVAPAAPRALAAPDGVTVHVHGDPVSPLSDRQREVYRDHARPDESFPAFLHRVHGEYSVRGGARALGVAKKTLYRWFEAHVEGFDRYSGR